MDAVDTTAPLRYLWRVMQVLAPDILADVIELPVATLAALFAVGLGLALTGWVWHRFWLTISVSLISGLVGLRQAAAWGIGQPVLAGALLAAAAGCLALSLARVGLFLGYGLGTWYAMKRFAPAYAVPAICICVGGLFSVLFYRFCVVLLTAALGSVLLCYAGLAVAHQQHWFAPLTWLQEQTLLAQGLWAGLTFMTLMLQLYFWRRAKRRLRRQRLEYTAAELESERRLGFMVRRQAA
jgi:hypothetical protein